MLLGYCSNIVIRYSLKYRMNSSPLSPDSTPRTFPLLSIPVVLILGFVAYGLSIYFYVYAQRFLGAARTSAYYAVAPFIGVFLSLLIFREIPGVLFIIALLFMILGAWLSSQDKPLPSFKRSAKHSH